MNERKEEKGNNGFKEHLVGEGENQCHAELTIYDLKEEMSKMILTVLRMAGRMMALTHKK